MPAARVGAVPDMPALGPGVDIEGHGPHFVIVDEAGALTESADAIRNAGVFGALRTALRTDEDALAHARWLPWHAVLHGLDALWLTQTGADELPLATTSEDNMADAALLAAVDTVQSGFATLFRRATPTRQAPITPEIVLPRDFNGNVRTLTYDEARVHVFLRRPVGDRGKQTVRFRGNDGAFVYNPLHEPGAPDRSWSERIGPGEPACFVVLPYEVSRVVIEAPPDVAQGRRWPLRITVKTRGELPGDHLLHLRIYDPGGERLQHYDKTVLASAGVAEAYVPLAFNDELGEYRLVVRDVLSGISAETAVNVR